METSRFASSISESTYKVNARQYLTVIRLTLESLKAKEPKTESDLNLIRLLELETLIRDKTFERDEVFKASRQVPNAYGIYNDLKAEISDLKAEKDQIYRKLDLDA